MRYPDLTYFIVADDGPGRWLTIAVAVSGGASVIGRWTTKQAAEDDAARWWALEMAAS